MSNRNPALHWSLLWLILMVAAMAARPHLPVDETRYLAVAWEMWLRGDFLVPHLNGEPYSHKPPLLFWLMQAGWAVFGVNDWWPRLVAPLFGLGSLILIIPMARALWPQDGSVAKDAPFILLGSLYWAVFATLTMFDTLLALTAMISLLGVLRAQRIGGWSGWLIFGLGIGIGVLAKGPAILLHTLPVAILAPLWDTEGKVKAHKGGWKLWYLGTGLGVLIGTAIGLAWAIPAAIAGGEVYRDAIFIGQTAGRMVKSFAHQRPWWFFLAIIGPMLLPWTFWPAAWRSLGKLPKLINDPGLRFCLAWFLPAFIAFSLISGKQPHYLLPDFPAAALIIAFLLARDERKDGRTWEQWLPAGLLMVIGAALLAAPYLPIKKLPDWVADQHVIWGGLIVMAGVLIIKTASQGPAHPRLRVLAGGMVVMIASLHLALLPRFNDHYSMKDNGEVLAQYEAAGWSMIHFGKYHGQYQFAGRLKKPLLWTDNTDELAAFLAANPDAKVISYRYKLYDDEPKPETIVSFRKLKMVIWSADQVRANPKLASRR